MDPTNPFFAQKRANLYLVAAFISAVYVSQGQRQEELFNYHDISNLNVGDITQFLVTFPELIGDIPDNDLRQFFVDTRNSLASVRKNLCLTCNSTLNKLNQTPKVRRIRFVSIASVDHF